MNLLKYITKTASCPTFGDWAIANKRTVKWGSQKRGDIVLFDFNHNGTSDHIGIVTKVGSGCIETIEGNTGNGSDTNGDGVYRRTRYKNNVNYFVRPNMPSEYFELIIATAEAQVGYREGKNNNNKYGAWFGANYQPWCCQFVCWVYAHCNGNEAPIVPPTGTYTGRVPNTLLKNGSKGEAVKQLQSFLNWYYAFNLVVDGEFGDMTEEAVRRFQTTEGITSDGEFGSQSYAKASLYCYVNTVTINPPTVTKPKKCVDTSYWQGKITLTNWKKVKANYDYSIHRASYTSQNTFQLNKDSTFDNNMKYAHEAGLKCGAYHYSQATSVAEAKKEAEFLCSILNNYELKNYAIDFYVVCDYEFGNRLNSEIGTKASSIANAFCDVVKSYGYKPMIYGNLSMMNNYLKSPNYPVWLAQYNSKCTYKKPYAMWQYTSSGSVNGISGRVDLSYVYEEPTIVEPPKEPVTPTKSTYPGAMPDFVALSGDIISNLAKKCAWPVGTAKKKYAFLTGSPFGSYKTMLNKAYPNRTKWSKRPKAGSSCDVFVGTIARASGADTKYPRGLAEQIKYSSPTLKAVSNVKQGDIVRVSGHTLVVVDINGVLWEAEASYGTKGEKYSKYPAIYSKAKKSYSKVLRCNKAIRSYLQIGDTGAEVKKLQAFLKWYGYTLTVDGEFGQITQGFVKLFQSAEKLTVDGQFGTASVAKAKTVER